MGIIKNGEGFSLTLFIFGVVAGLVPVFDGASHRWPLTMTEILITFYFFKKRSPLTGTFLFLSILNITFFILRIPSFWLFNLIISVIVYLIIAYSFDPLKKETGWLKAGRIDREVLVWIIFTVIISSAALLLWTQLFKPDMSKYFKLVPDVRGPLIVAGIIGFSLFNATAEEFLFRGLLWDGAARLISGVAGLIILQSIFFGICHYKGFPSGALGVGLAFVYGIFLGTIRHLSGGLLFPITAHIFADFTISLIVLRSIGKI